MAESVLKNLSNFEINIYQKNRFPWLFIDFISEIKPGVSAKGYKNFSFNESFLSTKSLLINVPSFIIGEALEQMFLMSFMTLCDCKGRKTNTISSNVKYLNEVQMGKTLHIQANLTSFSRGIAKGKSIGIVNNKIIAEAEFKVVIPDIMNNFIPSR